MDNNDNFIKGAKKSYKTDNIDKHPIDECVNALKNFITTCNIENSSDPIDKKQLTNLIDKGIKGESEGCYIRCLLWKITLGYLPINKSISDWVTVIKEQRDKFKQKVKSLSSLKNYSSDPLGQGSSEWSSFFEENEMKKLIIKDIDRTFQEKDLFRSNSIKEMLVMILFIWSKDNKCTKYWQGMNEILALVLLSIHPYYFDFTQSSINLASSIKEINYNELYLYMNNLNDLAADCYSLFCILMERAGKNIYSKIPINDLMSSNSNIQSMISSFSKLTNAPDINLKNDGLKLRIETVFNSILKSTDPKLYEYLVIKNEFDYFMVGQRWYRCIFSREFHYSDCLKLCDAMFCTDFTDESYYFSLMEYFACAMVLYVKDDLYNKDKTGCLMRLNKYPPVESIKLIIDTSLSLKKKLDQRQINDTITKNSNNNSNSNENNNLKQNSFLSQNSSREKTNVFLSLTSNELAVELKNIIDKYSYEYKDCDKAKLNLIIEAISKKK